MMIFYAEQRTEVCANNGGGVSIQQFGDDDEISDVVSFYDPVRIRAVATAMLRFADIVEARKEDTDA